MKTQPKTKQTNFKYLFESLEYINELQKDHYVVIEKPGTPFDKSLAHFPKQPNKGFSIYFEDRSYRNFDLSDIEHLYISTKTLRLYIESVFINSISPPKISGSVSNFQTESFDKNKQLYYRLIIPLKQNIDFHYSIEKFFYQTKDIESSQCLRIDYEDLAIDFYLYGGLEKGPGYLVLDTNTKCTYNTFSEYCFSSLVTFGFVTGNFPQDEGYYLAYEISDLKVPTQMYYTEFRDSMHSMYFPIYSNAYSYIRDKGIANKIHRTLRVLTRKEFSKLCQWTYGSVDFASILLLIIEASTSSLLVMPSGFSVALESLTELIVKENQEKLAPINDKRLAKTIRADLEKVIDSHSTKIKKEGIKILKSRIENINQITNQSKLTKPFELVNFKLSNEDISAIKKRNDFLHGRLNLEFSLDKTNASKEIYYVSLRLYSLLSALILKSIGYDNKIVNYPKIHEHIFNKHISEDYFRQL